MLYTIIYDKLSKVNQRSGPNVTTQTLALIVYLEQSLANVTVQSMVQIAITAVVDCGQHLNYSKLLGIGGRYVCGLAFIVLEYCLQPAGVGQGIK